MLVAKHALILTKINSNLRTEIAEARAVNRVHETTIGTLVLANKMLHERWAAEISHNVRRQVVAGAERGPEV